MKPSTFPRATLALAMILAIGGAAAPARPALAAELTVTRTDDTITCTPGDCSLRGAILEANKSPGPDVILLPAGTYLLTRFGADGGNPLNNNAVNGDLDIVKDSNVTIVGDGPDATIVDGNGDVTGDRVFDVDAGGILQIGGATIRGGRAGLGFYNHGHGAGIHNHGSLILQNVVISDNRVVIDNWGGGGITNADAPQRASSSLNNVLIRDNEALNNNGGGGGIENKGFLNLENSTLAGNRARNGGGIDNRGVNALAGLVNVTVTENRAVFNGAPTNGFGGGIDNAGGATLGMVHVTLNANSGDTQGGNLAALDGGKSVTARNTIFANGSPADCFIGPNGGYTSGGHNLATDANCNLNQAGDRAGGQVWFGPLQDNGGKTPTLALLPPEPDHTNEAIDGCDPAASTEADQRGEPRPRDGDGDGTATCDMGAFEIQHATRPADDNDNRRDDNDNDNEDVDDHDE